MPERMPKHKLKAALWGACLTATITVTLQSVCTARQSVRCFRLSMASKTFPGTCGGWTLKSHLHAERLAQEGRLHALPLNAESGKAAERLVLLIISDEVLRMRIGTNSAATVN